MSHLKTTVLPLIIATSALAHSLWLHSQSKRHAAEVLRERETAFVHAVTPKMRTYFANLIGPDFNPQTFDPATLEDLAAPYVTLLDKMTK
jgi:hypothetical protein